MRDIFPEKWLSLAWVSIALLLSGAGLAVSDAKNATQWHWRILTEAGITPYLQSGDHAQPDLLPPAEGVMTFHFIPAESELFEVTLLFRGDVLASTSASEAKLQQSYDPETGHTWVKVSTRSPMTLFCTGEGEFIQHFIGTEPKLPPRARGLLAHTTGHAGQLVVNNETGSWLVFNPGRKKKQQQSYEPDCSLLDSLLLRKYGSHHMTDFSGGVDVMVYMFRRGTGGKRDKEEDRDKKTKGNFWQSSTYGLADKDLDKMLEDSDEEEEVSRPEQQSNPGGGVSFDSLLSGAYNSPSGTYAEGLVTGR
ncbi:MAG: hypothetical protein ACR2PT_20645, partial [Endozoicomonas sp.]